MNFVSRLGAINDGSAKALSCKPSSNYIMTPVAGYYDNATNLFFYSKCSVNLFKSVLLSPNMTYVDKFNFMILKYLLPLALYLQMQNVC